jgi:hypothetical protein
MQDRTRAKVAASVAAASLNIQVLKVIDLNAGHDYRIRAMMRNGRIDGFDYHTGHYFKGVSFESLTFFDHDTQAHVQLKLIGHKIIGFDLDTNTAFNGQFHGRFINLYDHGTGQIYRFTVV